MRRRWLAVRLGLVALLLVGTVPSGVAAQKPPRHVFLDADATRLAEIHTDGQTYVVYAVENRLPYASGLEVYADDRRVTDPATVDEVFQAMARRAGTTFEPVNRTVRRLRRVIERSQSIQTAASDAIEALNATIGYRQALEERTVSGASAWAAASERSDALQNVFALGISGTSDVVDLRNRLVSLRRSSAELEADARRVVTLLERRRRGTEINRSALYRRYRAVHAGVGALNEASDEAGASLRRMAETFRTAGSQARAVPQVGPEIERRFTAAARTLAGSADRLQKAGRDFASVASSLPSVTTNPEYQRRLTERWQQRQGAPTKVSVTVVEGLLVLAAGVVAGNDIRS